MEENIAAVLSGVKRSAVICGDVIETLRSMPDNSVHAIICDPPFGLEFMGEIWDSFKAAKRWESKAGFSSPGIGQRDTPWPSYYATSRFGAGNPTCATCKGRERGKKKCKCETPDWKPMGKRRVENSGNAPEGMTASGYVKHMMTYQKWCEAWAREAMRVLKPGAFLISAGGDRTHHRLVCALEDSGLEIRTAIGHVFGTGYPKSKSMSDIGRPELGTALKPAIEFWTVCRKPLGCGTVAANVLKYGTGALNIDQCRIGVGQGGSRDGEASKDKRYNGNGATDFAATPGVRGGSAKGRWPANVVFVHDERCVKLGIKKIKAITGTSAGRMAGKPSGVYGEYNGVPERVGEQTGYADENGQEEIEKWDCTESCPVRELDAQSGDLKSGMMAAGQQRQDSKGEGGYHGGFPDTATAHDTYGDSGGASRFFYTAKSSASEKWFYCKTCNVIGQFTEAATNADCARHGANEKTRDFGPLFGGTESAMCSCFDRALDAHKGHDRVTHPTQKPLDLMRWLVRLVTPPGGVILDPFVGSGTTGCAAALEGFVFIGIDQSPDYCKIAEARLKDAQGESK